MYESSYAGIPIGQLIYFTTNAESIERKYIDKPSAHYRQKDDKPMESMMWQDYQQ